MPKGSVLAIIGEEAVGQVLSQALTKRGYEVSLVASESEGLSMARHARPDLVIFDMDMPSANGAQACTELRSVVAAPIILLSAHAEESDIVLGLGVGADAYLTKPVSIPVLIAHIDAAIRRETTYRQRQSETRPIAVHDLTVDLAGCELRRNGALIPLSPTEFRLIRALAENVGRVLTRDQLLDSVWEMRASDVFSRTVDVHIGRLRRKIEDNPTSPNYIVTVSGVGYKLKGSY